MASQNVYTIPNLNKEPDNFFAYSDGVRLRKTPVVIDNGSYECRVGWASDEAPRMIFKNITAKQRGKKESDVQVGNDIANIEAVRWLLKTQFDRNVVTHFDIQEHIFDHIFSHLGIPTENRVDHPIVITEVIGNPSYYRQNMSELLFEHYHVPQVLYGIDALFSLHHNCSKKAENALVLSFGHHTTHIIPVLNGRVDIENSKRISLGGNNITAYLQRLLQLKHPHLTAAVTLSRAEHLVHQHCYVAENYIDELEKWADVDYFDEHCRQVQLPYNMTSSGVIGSGVGKMDICFNIVKRVQESIAKKKQDTLADDEEKLQQLISIQELLEFEDEATFQRTLQELGFSSIEELSLVINELRRQVQQVKNTLASGNNTDPDLMESLLFCYKNKEPPLFFFALTVYWVSLLLKRTASLFNMSKLEVGCNCKVSLPFLNNFVFVLQESALKRSCSDLDPRFFTEPDAWISAVRKRREELKEKKMLQQQRFLERAHNAGQKGKSRKREPQFSDSELDDADYAEEGEEMEEIIAEFEREFKKKQLGAEQVGTSIAEYYQLQLGTERIRAPEILFQPSIIGVEQAGVAETLEFVFSRYTKEQQSFLAQNVFVTGSPALLPGIRERLCAELLAMRPFQSLFSVTLAKNPASDSWKGARQCAMQRDFLSKFAIKRAEYEEKGPDYLKEHCYSNVLSSSILPSPAKPLTLQSSTL
ncbi:actin-related protein 5 [Dermacentor silvarum]|uniref:actin-related protein 5 n=1 Tax=Dermacentor silvarum TaxID=543639 RepID=UPI002100D77F|nr:actin-related protein 5 [Dermacentor silvarum]